MIFKLVREINFSHRLIKSIEDTSIKNDLRILIHKDQKLKFD